MSINNTPDSHAVSNAVSRTVDNASGGAHRAIDRASDAARPTVDQLASGAHKTVERVAGAANSAARSINAGSDQLKETGARFADTCRTQLHEKPITTIGIAVGVGVLLSWLMRSR